jgi:hypothetical protein
VVFALLSAVVLGGAITIGGMVIRACTAPARGLSTVIERTFDGDSVVYNYEWFKRQAGEIRAQDQQVTTADEQVQKLELVLGERSSWDRDDKEEHARLTSIATGLRQERARMVQEYNARSRMANRSIFKGDDVPERFEP